MCIYIYNMCIYIHIHIYMRKTSENLSFLTIHQPSPKFKTSPHIKIADVRNDSLI